MTKPFIAAEYKDEYQERLKKAIMQKIKGHDVIAVEDSTSPTGNVIDLMEALQKSLDLSDSQKKAGNE